MFHKKTIVLNSGKVALDILEARSAIYSDRPTNWMAGELAGRKRAIFSMSLVDPRFKISRRLLQTGLNTRASKSYRPIQMQETQTLLQNLANAPEDFATHIRRWECPIDSACMTIYWQGLLKECSGCYIKGCLRIPNNFKWRPFRPPPGEDVSFGGIDRHSWKILGRVRSNSYVFLHIFRRDDLTFTWQFDSFQIGFLVQDSSDEQKKYAENWAISIVYPSIGPKWK
jgi:hypothetical protein